MNNMASISTFSVIILISVTIKMVYNCPTDVCVCKWKGGKQTVECSSSFLENIPTNIDPGTQVLNFTGNSLQILKSDRFFEMNLINLQKIYLCRNQLTRIHDKAFRGLSNLVELDLADNMLTTIPTETFQDYSSLMRLTLNGNPIRELKSNAFRYLSFLTTLELSNCQIERIDDEAFFGMDNLEWLKLDGNRIGTIKGGNILPKSLHGINLYSNRWNCDCNMIDLHAWLINYNIPQQIEDPKCLYPAKLSGQVIKYLKTEELACLPDITPTTLYLELSEGRNISLLCKISAIPEAQISWWFQGQILQNDSFVSPNFHLYYFIEDNAKEKRSELFIYNTKSENSGTFSCVAENFAGRAQTNYTIRVIVKGEPIPEPISFSYRYFMITIIGAGVAGFVIVLIVCCLILKCISRSRRRGHKKRKSSKDSAIHFQNSKNSSIIGERHHGQMPIIKSNGGINMPTQQDTVMLLNQNLSCDKVDIASSATTSATNQYGNGNNGNGSGGGNGLGNCGPFSPRMFYDQNPDLINDAESVKGRMIKNDHDETGSVSSSIHDKSMIYEPSACHRNTNNMMTVSMQNTNSNTKMNSMTATLPRGIIKDSSYQHQVDVHLNPGCFLDHDGGYPVTYRLHSVPIMPHLMPQMDNKVNMYRTLPHKSKHHNQYQLQHDKSLSPLPSQSVGVGSCGGYSMETQFVTQSSSSPFDVYAYSNMRYTAEGYPRQSKQVAFADQQQFPSPPEGYKLTQPLPLNATTPCNSPPLQQWPPCLPGYHQTQIVPIKIQNTDGAYGTTTLSSSIKRCVAAQPSTSSASSVDGNCSTSTSAADENNLHHHHYHHHQQQQPQQQQHQQHQQQPNRSNLTNTDDDSVSAASSSTATDDNNATNQVKHLVGPLADSPDEGYVGDSQDGLDI